MEGPGEWVHIEERGLSPGGEDGTSEAGLEGEHREAAGRL